MSRRPGITFETVTPSVPETLPRMDVAAFVGFATRGPIDRPVPVEDVARFRDVFGPPLELVRSTDEGRMQTAHLHRAVASFFRNGGQRCWVVRVANPPGAGSGEPVSRTSFPLPGLVSASDGRPASVRARCYGATFDDRSVGSLLHTRRLPDPASVEGGADGLTLAWTTGQSTLLEAGDVSTGDLLRLPLEGGPVAFAAVTDRLRGDGDVAARVDTGPVSLFRHDPPALAGAADVTAEVQPVPDASGRDASGSPLVFDAQVVRQAGTGDDARFLLTAARDAVPGDAERLDGRVVHVQRRSGGTDLDGWLRLGAPGPGSTGHQVAFSVRDALWPAPLPSVYGTGPPPLDGIERLTFDLLVWQDRELQARIDGLGFAAAHPRAWTDLPVDDDLFAMQDGAAPSPEPGTLRGDAFSPRFPLAAPDPDALAPADDPVPDVFIPLGMADRPAPESARGRRTPDVERSRLEKERLSTFSPSAFLDDDLAGTRTALLDEKAGDKIHIRQEPATGLHSLWPVQEVTLLAVPDAVHRGWTGPQWQSTGAGSTPVLPEPDVITDADPPVIRLHWTVSGLDDPGVTVEVQEATEPTFEAPVVRYRGSDAAADRFVRDDLPVTLYFRMRVVRGDAPGAWSNTRRVDVPEPDFTPCADRPDTPELHLYGSRRLRWTPAGGDERVFGDASTSGGDADDGDTAGDCVAYEVQIDTVPSFDSPTRRLGRVAAEDEAETAGGPDASDADASDADSGDADSDEVGACWSTEEDWKAFFLKATEAPDKPPYVSHDLSDEPGDPPVRYVRVRAIRATGGQKLVSGWSQTVAVTRLVRRETAVVSKAEYDDPTGDTPGGGRRGLYDVQRAMLRFGAARGDVVSILSLPGDDQGEDARRHVARLRTPGAVLSGEEDETLSYGALYHPWLLGPSGEDGGLLPTPPDGAACGTIAAQTLSDGAWTAPANEPVAGVRTVVPPLKPGAEASLADQNVNVFTEAPPGVLTLGSDTLARSDDLAPLTTRRLLILIRRLVEREGPELVFENNTALLRRRIAEQFDALLRRLFQRGAFAGRTPEEGYRVVTGPSVNPPEQVERGRLVTELRVAPARPLRFLTVRLVQRGNQSPSVVEAVPG